MLIESLKTIQLEWELDQEKLSAITHTPISELSRYLTITREEETRLPSVPTGLENTVALVSVFKNLKKKFPNTEDQLKWLFAEHQDFGGFKPIDIMSQTKDNLFWVSYYLESAGSKG